MTEVRSFDRVARWEDDRLHTEVSVERRHPAWPLLLAESRFPSKNGLDTAGHGAGYLLVRNLLLEDTPTEPSTHLLYESELLASR